MQVSELGGSAVYSPVEIAKISVEEMNSLQNIADTVGFIRYSPKIGLGLAHNPLFAGRPYAVLAQTGNGKTSFLTQFAEAVGSMKDTNSIFVDVENTIEEIALGLAAAEQGLSYTDMLKRIEEGGTGRSSISTYPAISQGGVYYIAGSKSGHRRGSKVALSVDEIREQVMWTVDHLDGRGIRAGAVMVDYLQRLPISPAYMKATPDKARRLQVRHDIDSLDALSKHSGSPMVVGVQAGRDLRGAPSPSIPLPGWADGEEANSIAQYCTSIISLWHCATTARIGSTVTFGAMEFEVTPDLTLIRIAKQNKGVTGNVFAARINFETNTWRIDNNVIRFA